MAGERGFISSQQDHSTTILQMSFCGMVVMLRKQDDLRNHIWRDFTSVCLQLWGQRRQCGAANRHPDASSRRSPRQERQGVKVFSDSIAVAVAEFEFKAFAGGAIGSR